MTDMNETATAGFTEAQTSGTTYCFFIPTLLQHIFKLLADIKGLMVYNFLNKEIKLMFCNESCKKSGR